MSTEVLLAKPVGEGVSTIRLAPFEGAQGASILVAHHFDGNPAGTEFLDYDTADERDVAPVVVAEALVNDGYTPLN